jgi:hypothetical protein
MLEYLVHRYEKGECVLELNPLRKLTVESSASTSKLPAVAVFGLARTPHS